ncbi:MAG: hypothetical protein K2G55_17760 [Lachnospiraceae bacterium]|nr:hypothetical protein [Lachnospiraceae bacterium]MDE7205036.1 hypothetical protein [Lachnospiraceae bacterium]
MVVSGRKKGSKYATWGSDFGVDFDICTGVDVCVDDIPDFIEETGKPQRVSSPVIMIKEPHQTGRSCRAVMYLSHRLRCWHLWSGRWDWIFKSMGYQ